MPIPDVFVARQPILDNSGKVQAYELLFRAGSANSASQIIDSRMATCNVISAAYLHVGIEELSGGRPVFINFDRELLVDGTILTLEPEQVVVEVLEDVLVDDEVVESIKCLKGRGFRIALDDFTGGEGTVALVAFADIVKVDLLGVPPSDMKGLLDSIRSSAGGEVTLLAEKVETHQQLAESQKRGFELFQGYYFSKPEVVRSRRIPDSKLAQMRLFQAFQAPDVGFDAMEEIVKSDVALSSKLLKYINAAAFPWAAHIDSVKRALVLLGISNIRKWIALLMLTELSREKPRELAVISASRGRFCELAGQQYQPKIHTEMEYFLVGSLSTLEAMLDTPMDVVLQQIPVSEEVRNAVCGQHNDLWLLLEMVKCFEQGDWDRLEGCCEGLPFSPTVLSDAYQSAVQWADRVLSE